MAISSQSPLLTLLSPLLPIDHIPLRLTSPACVFLFFFLFYSHFLWKSHCYLNSLLNPITTVSVSSHLPLPPKTKLTKSLSHPNISSHLLYFWWDPLIFLVVQATSGTICNSHLCVLTFASLLHMRGQAINCFFSQEVILCQEQIYDHMTYLLKFITIKL